MRAENPPVAILMAVFNGEKYLRGQLDSILLQSYTQWELWVRDDGSTDGSLAIVHEYAARAPGIKLLVNESPRQGSLANFSALMDAAGDHFGYYMFCDQDDVWLPGKIAAAMAGMKRLEGKFGAKLPLLVYSNFTYVTQDLEKIPLRVDLSPPGNKADALFKSLFVQNTVYGCTMLFNQPLLSLGKAIPAAFSNHDYWLAFVAASCGRTLHLTESAILYRQHAANVTSPFRNSGIKARVARLFDSSQLQRDMAQKRLQCELVVSRFGRLMDPGSRALIGEFVRVAGTGGLPMWRFLVRHRIWRKTMLQNVLLFITCWKGTGNT
ncbi:glycosyltransferase family 2 protein [Hufsiella ginkgonis]|uniref:Glycosyltransferase n=1 Tax=Hufsiella ginkgonis TaxID=2695274 RepID=A0A7K1Y2R4_9SPHI|nr:glycosyltransferase family 2 protein [Hufsiella ginkgonis]MXV17378.1 glycosyltransferase [Hufsiella ginkgonis]